MTSTALVGARYCLAMPFGDPWTEAQQALIKAQDLFS